MNDLHSQDKAPQQAAPEQIEVAPGTLSLLGGAALGAPLVGAVLDAYLKDRGHDPSKKWRLVLTGAVIVSDDEAPAPGAVLP